MGYLKPVEVSNVLSYVAINLSGGIQYEFKVCAKNKYGWGAYSLPSRPVATHRVRHAPLETCYQLLLIDGRL